jgi:hypothetical protein
MGSMRIKRMHLLVAASRRPQVMRGVGLRCKTEES